MRYYKYLSIALFFFLPLFAYADYIDDNGLSFAVSQSSWSISPQPLSSSSLVTITLYDYTGVIPVNYIAIFNDAGVNVTYAAVSPNDTPTQGGNTISFLSTQTSDGVYFINYYNSLNGGAAANCGVGSTGSLLDCENHGATSLARLYIGTTTVPTNTTTHIETTSPYNGEATSTISQSLGATGYINPLQYKSGMYLNIALTNQVVSIIGGSALDAWNAATGNNGIQVPITAAGFFDVSTTTYLTATGTVQAVYTIRSPTFLSTFFLTSLYFSADILFSTSTVFEIGTSTPFDLALSQGGAGVVNYLTTGTTTPLSDFSACAFSSFSVTGCILAMFVPSQAVLQNDLLQAQQGIAVHAPWGYAYRMVQIFTSTTTPQDLPTFTATIQTGETSTTSLTFDPTDMLSGGATLLNGIEDPNSGHNMKDIVQPFVRLFIALSVFIIIFHDLLSMGNSKKHT